MHRLRAAVVLLLVAVAWAPVASGGTAADPELTDPAGDQQTTRPASQVPIPGVNDESFDDVDIVAAWFEQRTLDCVGEPPLACPRLTLMVQTTAAWGTGTLTATFNLQRGPTSYSTTNASGQAFTITVQGTAVTGLANATADVGADGLRIQMPIPRLGAVGGDVITGLNLTTTRTDVGPVTNPTVTQDDQTGSDSAGPGDPYILARPAPRALVEVTVAQTGGTPGDAVTVTERATIPVTLNIRNLGTDDDAYSLAVTSDPPLQDPPVLAAVQTALPRGAQDAPTIQVSLAGMGDGTLRVTFTVTTTGGATDSAAADIVLDLPAAADRKVVPAGLDFLSPATQAMGFDDAFDDYGELALLALIVLLVILAIFLLVALAPSTLAGLADPEAPPVKSPEHAPAALFPAVAVPAGGGKGAAEDDSGAPADAPPAAAPVAGGATAKAADTGAALRIDTVTHTPDAPDAGEDVATEVVLRNDGPTRQVRVILAVDGKDHDEAALTLPKRGTKTVKLAWTAGPGENRVRVRVLPA